MAAPHVTGSLALITEWWRGFNAGANSSPAMAKALLVNGAEDMGTADIPNGDEGWGRINLSNVIDTGISTFYLDQTTVFASTGNTWSANFIPANTSQPVKVTLAWSDAPGPGHGVAAQGGRVARVREVEHQQATRAGDEGRVPGDNGPAEPRFLIGSDQGRALWRRNVDDQYGGACNDQRVS